MTRRPVLCAVDRSPRAEAAARLAAGLAQRLEAPLLLVHAVRPRCQRDGWDALPAVPGAPEEEHRAGDELLADLADRVAPGFPPATLLLVGDPAGAVIDAAAAQRAAVVVTGARGLGRAGRIALGSVSGRLAAGAPCPVLLAPPALDDDGRVPSGPVVHAVARMPGAARAAGVAAAFAASLDRELVLAHVYRRTGVRDDEGADARAVLDDVGRLLDRPVRAVAEPALTDVADGLLEVARREGAAVLTLASRGRGPARSGLLGSVASDVVRRARLPVLVVPPSCPAPARAELIRAAAG